MCIPDITRRKANEKSKTHSNISDRGPGPFFDRVLYQQGRVRCQDQRHWLCPPLLNNGKLSDRDFPWALGSTRQLLFSAAIGIPFN